MSDLTARFIPHRSYADPAPVTESAILELWERMSRVQDAIEASFMAFNEEAGYAMLVLCGEWLNQPFRIMRGETRGQVENRWRRWQAANGGTP